MQISRVKIMLTKGPRLLAYVEACFDECFLVKDIKIINGPSGVFVAMPERRGQKKCSCGIKNINIAKYCNFCGAAFTEIVNDTFFDVCFPVTSEFRAHIQSTILEAYYAEVFSKQPSCETFSYERDSRQQNGSGLLAVEVARS